MKAITKAFLIPCFLFISLSVSAHSPDISSTLLVEESPDKWILQIRAALTAFKYEVENVFGKSSYDTPEAFQKLVLEHVQKHVSIQTNGTNAILNNGIVKLGHETSITFEVSGIPSTIESLEVRNSSFEDIARNQSALIVLKKGFGKDQFELNKSNGHTAILKVANSNFVLSTPVAEKGNNMTTYLVGSALVTFALLFFIINRRKVKT